MLRPLRTLAFSLCLISTRLGAADSAMTEWKDAKGAAFKGEPIEAMGPLALFRTGATSSRFVALSALSAEDCVRFYQATAGRSARAAKWSEAKGKATGEFVGRLMRVEGGQLKKVNLDTLPEPELLLVFFGSRKAEGVNHLLDNLGPFVTRVQRVYPGRVATVLMSTWEGGYNQQWLPAQRQWYFADPGKQADMKTMARFVPGGGFVVMLMTREGVPLIGRPVNDVAEATKFVDSASAILWELNPVNPRTWRDRAHYLKAVRPVQFAAEAAPPMLLADPFRVDVLRARGVARIHATVDVESDGTVRQVTMLPTAELPAPLAAPLGEAIRRSGLALPAIERGTPTAGTCEYDFKVPPPTDKHLAADAAWVNGEARVNVALPSWLILKPIKVSSQVFSSVISVGDDGIARMSAVTTGDPTKVSKKTQANAFNSDWFAEKGPGSVHPNEGEKLEIDGQKLTWKRVKPEDGLVDFLGSAGYNSLDYCVGYAWTEVDIPADTEAWLGIGSDDGLKAWVNGEQVIDKWIERTSRLDDEVVPLKLHAGKNQILIKIQNAKGLWSFTARLRVRGQ